MRWVTLLRVLVHIANIIPVVVFSPTSFRPQFLPNNIPQVLEVKNPTCFQQQSSRRTFGKTGLLMEMDSGDNGGNKNNGGRDGGGDGEFENNGFGDFFLGAVTLLCSQLGKDKLKRKISVIPKPYSSAVHRLFSRLVVSMASFKKTSPRSISKWYSTKLECRPLATKSLTSGVVAFCGDYFAQWFEWNLRRRRRTEIDVTVTPHERLTNGAKTSNTPQKSSLNIYGAYDLRRGASLFVDGILFTGPLLHWGYGLFEKVMPVSGGSGQKGGSLAAIVHVLADTIILDSIFVATALTTSGLIEGQSFRDDIIPQFQNDYKNTMKMSWTMSTGLMPLEFICFRFLPLSYRVLATNFTSIFWDGAISFLNHRSRSDPNVVVAI